MASSASSRASSISPHPHLDPSDDALEISGARAPLALSAVRRRYPSLYRQYAAMSEQEREGAPYGIGTLVGGGGIGGEESNVDPITGLCTTINFADFTAPLEDNGDCPMATDSDANRFSTFIGKLLDVCETGLTLASVEDDDEDDEEDDATRQFDVLNAALDDVLSMSTIRSRFEHMLGWTSACTNHGLHSLLSEGDPDRNRALFKSAADEWKKLHERTADGSIIGVDETLRKFALWTCEGLQSLLKGAKREYGDRAKYNFNYVIKRRARKDRLGGVIGGGPPVVSKVGIVPHSVSAPRSRTPPPPLPLTRTVTVVVTKPSREVKLGLGIAQEKGASTIKVTSMAPDSLFLDSELKVGMVLRTINGMGYASFAEGSALLKAAEGEVTIVAAFRG